MDIPSRSRFFVRAQDVPPYHPANHTGTVNRRLIGAGNVGAAKIEVVLGVIEKGKGALPHSHTGIEQVCYLLEGRARAEVGGEVCDLGPGRLLLLSTRHGARVHGRERRAGEGAGDLRAAIRRARDR